MNDYKGTIIEESLDNKDVLKKVQILSTKVESITDKHRTPWLKQWTLHFALIKENEAENVALEISKSFDKEHTSWYADYRNKTHHYIIFPNKIFLILYLQKISNYLYFSKHLMVDIILEKSIHEAYMF